MSNIDDLDYIDNCYKNYKEIKKFFKENSLGFRLFAVGHDGDFRLTATMGKDEEGKDKINIKEQEEISLGAILPQGMKIIYFDNQTMANLFKAKRQSIRNWINMAMFPLYEDDVIDYELFLNDEKILDGNGTLGTLKINIKNLREQNKIKKNSLMNMKISVVEYGDMRKALEKESYLKNDKSTKEYLKFLTSKKNVQSQLSMLVSNKNLDRLKERFSIYGIDASALVESNVKEYMNQVPEHFDFDFENLIDIEGKISSMGNDFSNEYLDQMDYNDQDARSEQLVDFFKEKMLVLVKK